MIGLPILAAIGNMVFNAASNVIIKSQSDKFKPTALLFIQSIVACISFIILTASLGYFMEMFKISWQAILLLVGAAVMGIIIGNFLYFSSLQIIGVSIAYPISMTYPLLTYIFEITLLDAEFVWEKLMGILLVIVGVILISFSKVNGNKKEIRLDNNETKLEAETENQNEEVNIQDETTDQGQIGELTRKKLVVGILLALIPTITWSLGTTLIKIGLNYTDVNIIPINGARMSLLVPISSVIFLSTHRRKNKSKLNWKAIGFVVIAAIFGLFLSNIFYLYAIDNIGTSTPAAIAASGPLIATPLSMIFLKEKVDWKIILGTLLTVGGILIVTLFN